MRKPKVLWAIFGLPFIICYETKKQALKEMGNLKNMVPTVKDKINGPHKYLVKE